MYSGTELFTVSGTTELFTFTITYCSLKVLYDQCKWWKFKRKRIIKEQMDWCYPLMRNETKDTTISINNEII